jgi:serine/threonine protein kinase
MKFIHSQGLIQRGLKRENILLDHRGYPKIGDLGNSRVCDLGERMTGKAGIPIYMVSWMYESDEYPRAVDLYSFALILYEVLVGKRGFDPTQTPMALMQKALPKSAPKCRE